MQETREVSSESVAAYLPMVEAHARKFAGRRGAEFDDLVQEGLVSVWDQLRRGIAPSNTAVINRMKDWVRRTNRLGMRVSERRRPAEG